jgi:hypothetical protein
MQKRLPALGRRPSATFHVSRHCRLGYFKAQHQQLAVDAGCAPKRIFLAHPPNQIPQSPVNPRPPSPLPRFPAPIDTESRSVPSQHGLRLNHPDYVKQARPYSNHPNHQGAITTAQSNPRRRVLQCKVQLVPKQQYLGFKSGARLDQVGSSQSKGIKHRKHRVS